MTGSPSPGKSTCVLGCLLIMCTPGPGKLTLYVTH